MECIFCKIAENEAKSWKIFEDNEIVAFLDINPATEGHTIIIPKTHYKDVFDVPDELLQEIAVITKRIAETYKKVLGTKVVNILHASGRDAQQEILHFHVHLIPRSDGDGINFNYDTNEKIREGFDDFSRKIRDNIEGLS